MQIIMRKTSELKHYKNNNKIHDVSNIEQIAASIDEFGFTVPILIDENDVIIAGHGRLEGAKHLGYVEVPCIVLDMLTSEQIQAYRVADNKLAEQSEWDFEALEKELKELKEMDFDMELLGFSEKELEKLLGETKEIDMNDFFEESAEVSEKREKTIICPHCGEEVII